MLYEVITSYGIWETFNLFIPRFLGGGSYENVGKESASYEFFVKAGLSRITSYNVCYTKLLRMILETSVQAQFLIPMAISLGFGIMFATGITLLLVPSLYLILEDLRRLVGLPTGHGGQNP